MQAAKLLAAGLQAAGLQAAGLQAARAGQFALRKEAETLYCCILRFKIHYASRTPVFATDETLILSQNQRLNRAQVL